MKVRMSAESLKWKTWHTELPGNMVGRSGDAGMH